MTDRSGRSARESLRSDIAAVSALALSIIAVFPSVVTGEAGFFRSDLSAYHRPLKWVWAQLVGAGEFPWWNPLISGGQPLAANPAYESFYPLQLFLLLPDFEHGFQLHILFHILLAGVGMYALLRSLGYGAMVGFAIALSFQWSGPVVATMIRLPFLFALAWMPLVLLFARNAIRRRCVRDLALASLAIGMQALVGEPVTVLQTVMLIAGYAICAGWEQGRTHSALRNIFLVAIFGVGGAALASVQLIPGFDHARHSVRSEGFMWADSSNWSTPPARLVEIAFPAIYRALGDAEGFQRISVMYPTRSEPYLPELYCGLLVVVCALVALIRATRRRWQLLAGSALFVALALATTVPLYRLGWQVGVFTSIRYPEKFLLGAVLPIFILAAAGLERLVQDRSSRRLAVGIVAAWASIAIAVHVGADAVPFTSAFASDAEVAAWPLGTWTLTNIARAAGAVALIGLFAKGKTPRFAPAATVFVMLDLAFVAFRHAPTAGRAWFDPPPIASEVQSAGRIINDATWSDIDGTVPEWVYESAPTWTLARDSMFPYRNVRWNIPSLLEEDIDATSLSQTATFNRAVLRARQRSGGWPLELLAGSGAGAVIRYKPAPDGDQSPVYADEIEAASRYWFAREIVESRDEITFTDLVARRRLGARTAAAPHESAQLPEGRVLAVTESPSRIRLRVTTENRALLVAAVTADRHWSVLLDGSPAEVLPVNIAWQGIWVPPGQHEVLLRYRNPLVIAGAMVSLFALAIIIASAGIPALARMVISVPRATKNRRL